MKSKERKKKEKRGREREYDYHIPIPSGFLEFSGYFLLRHKFGLFFSSSSL